MPRTHIPAETRRLVVERAQGYCEYCLLHQDDTQFSHQIDHLISRKHGGRTVNENLALACLKCNRNKGSDLTAIDPIEQRIVPLFNPRTQIWREHFLFDGERIIGSTATGRATVELLQINDRLRLMQRRRLMAANRYPPSIIGT
ncbi:MAG TPA: HNH endonuclease signature motif containing protein [Blastocatellia bacterium]|nr:HNH endonuclease signature motif containing protein [Blastocatellia bacterium]